MFLRPQQNSFYSFILSDFKNDKDWMQVYLATNSLTLWIYKNYLLNYLPNNSWNLFLYSFLIALLIFITSTCGNGWSSNKFLYFPHMSFSEELIELFPSITIWLKKTWSKQKKHNKTEKIINVSVTKLKCYHLSMCSLQ